MRLDKYLTECGLGTRKQVKLLLKQGSIAVNGIPIYDPRKIVSENDQILFRSQLLEYKSHRYYLLHKPPDVVCATEDRFQKTVIDILPSHCIRKNLFPVGRLDKDTEGLLLLTTDGDLAHTLLSPKKKIPKVYFARLESDFSEKAKQALEQGVEIPTKQGSYKTLPAEVVWLTDKEIRICIYEGKFHQIKLMLESTGNKVTYLKRESFGSLVLGDLGLGEVRELSPSEVEELRRP